MNRLLFFALLFLTISTYAQKTEYQVVNFGFYNFENLFDTIDAPNVRDESFTPQGDYNYNSTIYFKKQKQLAHVINEVGKSSPDGLAFFGVAEVENRSVLEDFVNQEAMAHRPYSIVHFDSPDRRGIDVALLYQQKYLTIVETDTHTLPIINPDGSTYPTRDILYVKGKLLGDPIHIFVNHWPSRGGGEAKTQPSRNRGAAICKQLSDSILATNPSALIVIMGDLNDDPVSPSVKKILNAKGKPSQVKPKGLYNPWLRMYKQGKGTLAYRDAWSLFDQVIISEAWINKKSNSWKFHKAQVYSPKYLVQKFGKYKGYPFRTFAGGKYLGGYSDHFPVYITAIRPTN